MSDMPLTDKQRDGLRGLFDLGKEIKAMAASLPKRRKRGPRMGTPRCPKCRAYPARYLELWHNHSIEFEASASGCPENEGNLEPGDPYAVIATCSGCDHHWRLRGIHQISEIWSAIGP